MTVEIRRAPQYGPPMAFSSLHFVGGTTTTVEMTAQEAGQKLAAAAQGDQLFVAFPITGGGVLLVNPEHVTHVQG